MQTYPYWELVIADASKSTKVKKICEAWGEERLRYISLENNAGISENTNRGIEQTKGDYIGLLDHDDYLTPDALYEMASAIEEGKKRGIEYGFLYSDEDKCNEDGSAFYDPHFKMDFNLDLFLTNNYICHFCVMKKELIQQLTLRKEYDGAQDYDLCLRAVDVLWKQNPKVEQRICHVPKVLYHWRCHNDSTAANPNSKRYAYEAGRRALQDFVASQGWKAKVEEMAHVGFYKVVYEGGIFSQRKDVVLLGGKEIKKGKITAVIFDPQGKPLYQGLPFCYSGYIHRAVLAQNVAEMDLRKAKINPCMEQEVKELWKKLQHEGISESEIRKKVCSSLINQGYRLYWDPDRKI